MWTKFAMNRKADETAENGQISRSFSSARLTVRKDRDCYTFERFASRPREIRTTYYYHYKRNRFGLKEETKWS